MGELTERKREKEKQKVSVARNHSWGIQRGGGGKFLSNKMAEEKKK